MREVLIFDDELMQIVSQEISAYSSSMPVIDAEEGALWPLLALIVLRLWLHDVENDGDSVFVVVSDDTLIGIGSISCHQTIPLVRKLRILIIRQRFELV